MVETKTRVGLTDEEIINYTIPPGQPLTEYHKLLKAQLKKVMEWGDGICEEHKHFCERWHCRECRQALLEEVKK